MHIRQRGRFSAKSWGLSASVSSLPLPLPPLSFFGSCLKVHTSDHEWPRMTTSDHKWPRVDCEWPRVTTSDYEWPRVRLHQNIWLMSWWRHHYIILSNNHYCTANWPFLETFIPGFDIFAISDWMGEGLGDGQGGGMEGYKLPATRTLKSRFRPLFLPFPSRPFSPSRTPPSLFSTRSPKFCPPPSLPSPLEGYQWPRVKKKERKWKWQI